jgi:hypothetical protein
MGYTSGFTKDQKFAIVTDIRVYQGDYIGGEIADPNTAGASKSVHAHGTFVEIWIDLWTYDLSSGSLIQQVHDFNPWTSPNGLFWIVKVPDSAVQISPDGNTLTIHLENVPVVDAVKFPPPVPTNFASDETNISPYELIRARTSFAITYTKTPGTARRIRPSTEDPLSPLNWAGKMWDATNSGWFSVAYDDGMFSASGTFSSGSGPSQNFGEMGTERNGFFAHHEDQDDNDDVEAGEQPLSLQPQPATISQSAATANTNKPVKFALLKGRVPVKVTH